MSLLPRSVACREEGVPARQLLVTRSRACIVRNKGPRPSPHGGRFSANTTCSLSRFHRGIVRLRSNTYRAPQQRAEHAGPAAIPASRPRVCLWALRWAAPELSPAHGEVYHAMAAWISVSSHRARTESARSPIACSDLAALFRSSSSPRRRDLPIPALAVSLSSHALQRDGPSCMRRIMFAAGAG